MAKKFSISNSFFSAGEKRSVRNIFFASTRLEILVAATIWAEITQKKIWVVATVFVSNWAKKIQ